MATSIEEIQRWAKLLRYDVCRMISLANSGHPGGSLSPAEIVAVLYFREMNIDPARPEWADRDRFILSKGHGCPVLYAALARRGYFPLETLGTLRRSGSILQGHPEIHTPGVDMTSGCLGQGLSAGAGMATVAKMDGKGFRVYVILGCGEMNEGQVYEEMMTAYHYKLDNLTVFLDYNRLQFDGSVEEVLDPGEMSERLRGFNWHVIEINGHNMRQVLEALDTADEIHDRPTIIVARTTKGKGVSFMENDSKWHGTPPDDDQYARAVAELKGEA